MDSKISRIIKKSYGMLPFFIACGIAVSCEHKSEYDFNPRKLFMPTGNISVLYQPDKAKLIWTEALHANPQETAYEIIVSTDTLFSKGAEFSFRSDTSFITLKKGDISKDIWYYARIRTVPASGNDVEASNWLPSAAFRISDDNSYYTEEPDI